MSNSIRKYKYSQGDPSFEITNRFEARGSFGQCCRMHVADKFRKELDETLESSGTGSLILNLSEVSFIDSSGLGVILGRYKKISLQNGKMRIIGANPQVLKILELLGITKIMKIFNTEEEALGCL